ncbi:MAG TPA: flagellar basal body L-ring protein FlgH [Planctomycetota bacterium]|nr:flagellar basal body L-ring protein FlgH [Planctomycetota bacterium]
MKLATLVCAVSAMLAGAVPVRAQESKGGNPGSLWGGGNLIAEKGFNRHDLVTIVIRESSKVGTKMDTTYDRKGELSLEIAKAFNIKTDKGLSYQPLTTTSKKPELDISSERKHENSGEIKANEEFSAKVTAEVIEILPNGQLVLEARKRVKIGEDTTFLVLTGRCRPQDVSGDNTVDSDRVADAHIQYSPKGAVGDANKRSLLTRFFDFINVF